MVSESFFMKSFAAIFPWGTYSQTQIINFGMRMGEKVIFPFFFGMFSLWFI